MSRVDLDRHLAALAALRRPVETPGCACALTGAPCPQKERP